jgi:hypothetical protein
MDKSLQKSQEAESKADATPETKPESESRRLDDADQESKEKNTSESEKEEANAKNGPEDKSSKKKSARNLSYTERLYAKWGGKNSKNAKNHQNAQKLQKRRNVSRRDSSLNQKSQKTQKAANQAGDNASIDTNMKNYAQMPNPNLSYEMKQENARNLFPNLPQHEFDEYIGRRLNYEQSKKRTQEQVAKERR